MARIGTWIVAAGLALAGAAPGLAQQTPDPLDMILMQERFNAGDYSTVAAARPLAEAGDGRAMVLLGAAYLNGLGVPLDEAQGREWMAAAAEAGNLRAQMVLGQIHYYGMHGAPVNEALGIEWMTRSAAGDYGPALAFLGMILRCGECGYHDPELAAALMGRSERMIDAEAMESLADMNLYDEFAGADPADARRQYALAALAGDASAANEWGYMSENGLGGPTNLDEAMYAFSLSVAGGYPRGAYNTAIMTFVYPDRYPDRVSGLAHCLWAEANALSPEDAAEFGADCDGWATEMTAGEVKQARGLVATIGPQASP